MSKTPIEFATNKLYLLHTRFQLHYNTWSESDYYRCGGMGGVQSLYIPSMYCAAVIVVAVVASQKRRNKKPVTGVLVLFLNFRLKTQLGTLLASTKENTNW